MAKPELGTKRVCPVTGRKFYDLNKDPIVSPFTGEAYPRSYFEPAARGASRSEPRGAVDDSEGEEAEAEVISLEEADEEASATAKVATGDDVDVDEDIEGGGDDDTFLEEDEDDGDDVSDLIGEGLEDDEEA